VAVLLTRMVLRYGQPAALHALFDAGAGKSDADMRALMDQAAATENLEVTLCDRAHQELTPCTGACDRAFFKETVCRASRVIVVV
jgi:hypothetical protein